MAEQDRARLPDAAIRPAACEWNRPDVVERHVAEQRVTAQVELLKLDRLDAHGRSSRPPTLAAFQHYPNRVARRRSSIVCRDRLEASVEEERTWRATAGAAKTRWEKRSSGKGHHVGSESGEFAVSHRGQRGAAPS